MKAGDVRRRVVGGVVLAGAGALATLTVFVLPSEWGAPLLPLAQVGDKAELVFIGEAELTSFDEAGLAAERSANAAAEFRPWALLAPVPSIWVAAMALWILVLAGAILSDQRSLSANLRDQISREARVIVRNHDARAMKHNSHVRSER